MDTLKLRTQAFTGDKAVWLGVNQELLASLLLLH